MFSTSASSSNCWGVASLRAPARSPARQSAPPASAARRRSAGTGARAVGPARVTISGWISPCSLMDCGEFGQRLRIHARPRLARVRHDVGHGHGQEPGCRRRPRHSSRCPSSGIRAPRPLPSPRGCPLMACSSLPRPLPITPPSTASRRQQLLRQRLVRARTGRLGRVLQDRLAVARRLAQANAARNDRVEMSAPGSGCAPRPRPGRRGWSAGRTS